MNKHGVAVFFAVIGVMPAAAGAQSPGTESPTPKSRPAMMAVLGDFLATFDRSTARARLEQIVAADPNYPEARFNLGLLWEAEGELSEARKHYQQALQLQPGPEALKVIQLGLARTDPRLPRVSNYELVVRQAADFTEAGLASFGAARAGDAVKIDPSRWEAYAIMADALASLQEYSRAKRALAEGLKRAPAEARVRLQQEDKRIDADMACAPAVNSATTAFNAGEFARAATLFHNIWKEPCGSRDEFGLAAATAYLRAGKEKDAALILSTLERSKSQPTRDRVAALRKIPRN